MANQLPRVTALTFICRVEGDDPGGWDLLMRIYGEEDKLLKAVRFSTDPDAKGGVIELLGAQIRDNLKSYVFLLRLALEWEGITQGRTKRSLTLADFTQLRLWHSYSESGRKNHFFELCQEPRIFGKEAGGYAIPDDIVVRIEPPDRLPQIREWLETKVRTPKPSRSQAVPADRTPVATSARRVTVRPASPVSPVGQTKAAAIAEPASASAGQAPAVQASPPARMLIADLTEDFIGRDYVFSAIDAFQADRRSGYFIIRGEPGVGKSAILAEYVKRTNCILHINSQAMGIHRAADFLESVCSQLITRYRLPYPELPSEATSSGKVLTRLLDEASQRLSAGERLVIAIDAVDEVDEGGRPRGANVLYLPPRLPQGVHVILTQRPMTLPLTIYAAVEIFDLADHLAESQRDIRAYLARAATRPKLHAWLRDRGLSDEHFIETLSEKSEHNFMYLRYVLSDLEHGRYVDLSLDRLPLGLVGYYEDHWRRMGMTQSPTPRAKIRIVYLLAEAPLPMTRALLAGFAKQDEMLVQEVLDDWEQFLRLQRGPTGTKYSVYHLSFRDFLHRKDVVQAAGETIQGIHAVMADNLWAAAFDE